MKVKISPIIAPLIIVGLLATAGVEIIRWQLTAFFDRNTGKTPVMEISNTPTKDTTIAASNTQTLIKNRTDLIIKRQLFGTPPETQQVDNEKEQLPVLTTAEFNIILMGTIGTETKDGKAIFMDKTNKKQQIYKTGDRVKGATVKKVLRGEVILSIGGQDKILQMNESMNHTPKLPPPSQKTQSEQAKKTRSINSS